MFDIVNVDVTVALVTYSQRNIRLENRGMGLKTF